MTRDEWVTAFAAAAGAPAPTPEDMDALLELAGLAAHASERTAAPITCWVAAVAGLRPSEALDLAESLQRHPLG
jgi:C4-dicarboxylate transporter